MQPENNNVPQPPVLPAPPIAPANPTATVSLAALAGSPTSPEMKSALQASPLTAIIAPDALVIPENPADTSAAARPIDYAPLNREISFKERTQAKGGHWIIVLIILTVLYAVFAVTISFIMQAPSTSVVFALIFALPLGLTIAVFVETGKRIRMSQFASLNNLGYASQVPAIGGAGMIFRQAPGGKYTEVLTSTQRSFAEIGNYQYETGEGKNRTTHNYGFVRIKLPRKLPNMLLDSKKNNFLGMSNLPETFSRSEKIALEGNFNNYFTLFAPEQYKTDAFYVFTPDVMQALIDAVHNYDCEVIDDDFYIYSSSTFRLDRQADLEDIMKIVDTLKPELDTQSRNYADERVGDRSANRVDAAGARLRQKTPWVIVVIFLAFFTLVTIVPNIAFFLEFFRILLAK